MTDIFPSKPKLTTKYRKNPNFHKKNMADESGENQKVTCTFFKKAKRKGNVRKRKAESSGSEDETSVVRKEKKAAPNPLKQKTGNALRTWETQVEENSKQNPSDKQGQEIHCIENCNKYKEKLLKYSYT